VARLHGRNGRIYIGLASNGTAEPLNFQAKWSLDFSTDKADATAMGDANKIFVAGLPVAGGDFSGWYDDATVQTYTAATDGVARKFYLYPSTSNNAQYWFGTVLPDFKVDGSVISFKATCPRGTVEGKTTYSGDTFIGETHMKMGDREMTQHSTGKFLGKCDGTETMKP